MATVTVTQTDEVVEYSIDPPAPIGPRLFAELLQLGRSELERASGSRPFVLAIGGSSGTITKGNGRPDDDLGAVLIGLFELHGLDAAWA